MRSALLLLSLVFMVFSGSRCSRAEPAGGTAPLVLERIVGLRGVSGRIDHLAADAAHSRIFVAELGNGSVEAVDLGTGHTRRLDGLKEPQGVAYVEASDELAVANGGDGTVRFLDATSLAERAVRTLGDDADNVGRNPRAGEIVVGYGAGALAVIDPTKRSVVRTIALPAHPEGFQIDGDGHRAFVNIPDSHEVAVVDLDAGRVTANWRATHGANFPMALDGDTVAIAYRSPARLVLLDAESGAVRQDLATCGDADDVFADGKRRRLYVSCGSGAVEAFTWSAGGYASAGRIETRSGARTSLFVPALDRLIVAAGAGLLGGEAVLLVYRPAP